ncbi:MAG: hypothetical protein IT379_32815 [Deltaproteobacteria bacterium]|nr:hypothetical protein [Deltaproteobacteria bacterium]
MSVAERVHLFPVRHHSPRASLVLGAMLDRISPEVVLVEGPSDADPLLPMLVHADTAPPIALLAYRTDGVPASSVWPFAAYSPEYVAVRWALAHGRRARFIDVSAAQSLAHDRGRRADDDDGGAGRGGVGSDDEPRGPRGSVWDPVVERSGFRSFDELWEARFEAPEHAEADFREMLRELALSVRGATLLREDGETRARDAIMRAAIERAVEQGAAPEQIVAVLGAAHVAAIVSGDVDPSASELLERTVPTAMTIIPYSFPRLAEQTGYGAGNRAPYYYQRAYDARGDYGRATLEVLVDFTDHLRLRGFSVSLADTLEAYRLACRLAEVRDKSGPGLDEVREASIATLCRGESAHVDGFLWSSVIGRSVGRVAKGLGRGSLQEEFWTTVRAFKLPETDEAIAVSLKLADKTQLSASTFLHRLRVLEIPYATLAGVRTTPGAGAWRGGAGAGGGGRDVERGGFEQLARVREGWQCQWTPATEMALVERIVLGESLRAAAERSLEQRLRERRSVGDAADVLVDAVMTNATGTVALALAACDALAAHDDDLVSLARACRALAGLVSYGSARKELGMDERVLVPLLAKTFARATLRLPVAASVGDADEAKAVGGAMRVLAELATTQAAVVDRDELVEELGDVGRSFGVHPRCAGTAAGLLLLSRWWDDAVLARELSLRLSATSEPGKTAEFLSGFLEVNALAIVKSHDVVAIVDAYLQSLSDEAFRDAVPMLRRALADLGKTERRYLVESVIAVRGHARRGDAREAARLVTAADAAALEAASEDIQKAMDDLDDLL